MPGKGKTNIRKLSDMTDEERAIYLEQKRLAEEELQNQKMTQLAEHLQDKLNHEEEFTKLNQMKLTHYWRAIMRETKSKELKRSIDTLSQTFDGIMDRKESIIKTLVANLSEADEQHLTAIRSHLENVDILIDLQNQRLQKLRSDYEKELQSLVDEFLEEEKFLREQHEKQLNDLKTIFIALDTTYSAKVNQAVMDQSNLKDEMTNHSLEEKHALRMNLNSKIEDLSYELKQATDQYNTTMNEKMKFFDNLKSKNDKTNSEIQRQFDKIQKINKNITAIRRRMTSTSNDYKERYDHLKEERDKLIVRYQMLKFKMKKSHDLQYEKLIKMSVESGEAIKKVESLLKKAERIIKLGEECRKYETEEEKLTPFYSLCSPVEDESLVRTSSLKQEQIEEITKNIFQSIKRCLPIEMFWKRFNKVQLERLALTKEYNMLEEENIQLKLLFKQYLDGISIKNEIISGDNSIIIIDR